MNLLSNIQAAAAAAYALYQNIAGDPGITAMDEAKRLTVINETQALPGEVAQQVGLQVTLNYAYADANRIAISYTLTAETDKETPIFVSSNPTLTLADASVQRMLLGSYGTPETSALDDGRTGYTATLVSNFDSTSITPAPDSLSLVLDIETAISYPKSDDPYRMDLAGTAHFTFTVPFDPGRVMDTPQTATSGSLSMTLQKVVVAPSLTRIEMCYTDPAPEGRTWSVYGELVVNRNPVVANMALNQTGPRGEIGDEASPCHTLVIPASLADQSGAWTLTITDLRLNGSEDQAAVIDQVHRDFGLKIEAQDDGGYVTDNDAEANAVAAVLRQQQHRIEGPWTFTFLLPQ